MRALLLLCAALLLGGSAQGGGARLLDDFSVATRWQARAADGVGVSARPFEGGLRLDYDFSRGSGYAFMRRALPLELPQNFELRFRLRGEGPANALELKLVDASGENVWWYRRAEYVPPGQWQTIRVRRRQIDFAWGPATDRTLRRTAAIEFVVAAGSGGGRGWIAVDDLEIVPLPPPPAVPPAVAVRGGAARGGGARAVDGDRATAWAAAAGQTLTLDLGYSREFGGLVLRWAEGAHAPDFDVLLSPDRRSWTVARQVRGGDGGTDWLRMEESEARFVAIRPLGAARLAEVEVRPLAFGASLNGFVQAVAAEAPRGAYPRGFVGEQNYWTLVATPDGGESGLIDEDGTIEVGRRGFSIEPFVQTGNALGWADARSVQSLRDRSLPIPTVVRSDADWTLSITAVAERDRLVARYRLRNDGRTRQSLLLNLAVRPFQVNPPQQFLNITGGVSPIDRLAWRDGALHVNGAPRVRPDAAPGSVQVRAFDAAVPPAGVDAHAVEDPTGLASALLTFAADLRPGEEREIALSLSLTGEPRALAPGEAARVEAAAAAQWRAALGDVRVSGPEAARPVFDTLRTALAHVLATREGPALRPGSRAYARSWIRDGTMMSTALLRMGIVEPADRYLNWYAPYQYPDGKVPCCVDARGADPVPEHDSHGQLIHLVAELERYAPDAERLRLMWPRVRAAADHIEMLRQSTRTAAFQTAERRHLFGLLPPSISHEGYSARPAYSYWDDFWALAGLQDAAWIAGRLGEAAARAELAARADAFRADLLASLAAARRVHNIAFIPGAADLGDFDATSTTIALSVAGQQHLLPPDALAATFERYWQESETRRRGARAWDAYTPYEWRNVGALVRLGQRDRAFAMLDFFMADRRPTAWNQWAEVIGRLPREPRFIGDMPHGWVASDFINAVLDMLAYHRPGDGALVIGGGVPAAWLAGEGITVENLRTPWGRLRFTIRAERGRGRIAYRLDGRPPPGGLVLSWRQGNIRLTGAQGRRDFVL